MPIPIPTEPAAAPSELCDHLASSVGLPTADSVSYAKALARSVRVAGSAAPRRASI
eukprot:COSAG06_NODE_55518_length_289_cov_0.810526_1_plen_55_part_01